MTAASGLLGSVQSLREADSVDGNEIVSEITSSSARSIHFLCWIYLVLTQKKTIQFRRFAAEETVWLLNYCGGEIEGKRVQFDTVNDAQ